MGSFRSQFGQLPRIPAQTLLFHESGNKGCVRFSLLRNQSAAPSRARCLPYVSGVAIAPSSGRCCSLLHSAASCRLGPKRNPLARKRSRTAGANHRLSQQKPDRVTTTVVVHGEVKDNYLSDTGTGKQSGQHADPRDTAFRHRCHQRRDERPDFARALRRRQE